MTIKPRHLLSLLQTGFTTIKVKFADNSNHDNRPGKEYTYKIQGPCFAGDWVVVDSPANGLVVVRVMSVDEAPRIDLDAEYTYKWVVQRVDVTAYKDRLEKEKAFLVQVENAQRMAQRDVLLTQYAEAFPVGTPAGDAFAAAVKDFKTLPAVPLASAAAAAEAMLD